MLKKVSYADIARFSWHYWKQHIYKVPLLLVLMGMTGILDSIYPVFAGRLVDAITNATPGNEDDFNIIFWAFIAFISLEVFFFAFRNSALYLWNLVAVRCLYQITADAFHKVQRFSTDWHANTFAGATVRKITRGMWAFDTYEDILFMNLYPTFIVLCSTVIVMTSRWPIMGLVTLICICVYITINIYSVTKINAPRFRKSAEKDTNVGAALADAMTANNTIKSFGTEHREDKRFQGVLMDWRVTSLASWQMSTTTDMFQRYMSVGMMFVMLGSAIMLWQQGRATTGDIVYVFTAFMIISNYLRHIGEQISNLQRAMSEMEDVITFWKREDMIADRKDAADFVPTKGQIDFKDVTFSYDNVGKPLYKDFSITIEEGEKIALVGPSGSGKSTFVKLLQRLYDIDSGEIIIDGQNIADVKQSSLRQQLSLVPQDPVLFHRTIADNIAYGRPDATKDEIIDAAQKAYAHDFIRSLPAGYNTIVGERGVKLSGGERQRVAIARAILADTPVLILDEATSSLDSISEHYIQKALENLVEGKTTITIAHRLSTIKSVDRILVFENGRVIEQGNHDTLIGKDDSHYRKLWEMQAIEMA